jgi:hypothetical protein
MTEENMTPVDSRFARARDRALRPSFVLASLSLLACESQVTPYYPGEPLLSVSGSVTIADEIAQGDLVPTLGFENRDLGQLEIVNTKVVGEFPNEFTLHVYAPPPDGAMMAGPAGGPRHALGYIGAATVHHPSRRRLIEGSGEATTCSQEACHVEYEACPAKGECYYESRTCDLDVKNCVVTGRSGDLELASSPWTTFAGLSANYQVLYLQTPAPAGSPLAQLYAEGAELSSGYHLLEVRLATDSESFAAEQCLEQAGADVIEAYNVAHGTAYEDAFYVRDTCATDAKPCDDPYETLEALLAESEALGRERACGNGEVFYSLVEHPESTSITIRIAPDVGPLGEGESQDE